MYREKETRSSKIINFILAIIAIFLVIFIITWIIYKSNTKTLTKIFDANMQTMQEAAKKHFANDLPENIGDTKTLKLDEMYELELVDTLNYGTITCDEDLSYITVTKSAEDSYKVKSNLVCGDKNNSVTEKVTSTTIITEDDDDIINIENATIIDNDIIIDNEENLTEEEIFNQIDKEYENATSSDGKTRDICKDHHCSTYIVPTSCETEYKFEFVRTTVDCADGYVLSGNICVKTINQTADLQTETIEKNALINDGTAYKVYIDPIYTEGATTTTCPSGYNLENGACYKYIAKTTENSCPSGYELKNNKCYKYTDIIETATCPSGYEMKNGVCYNYAAINTDTTCPSGYELKNGACYKYANVITNSYCPSGYSESNGRCYKYADVRNTSSCPLLYSEGSDGRCYYYTSANRKSNTTYSCDSGYTLSGSTCKKTQDAKKNYSSWGNPTRTYTTSSYESPYTHDTEKKVLTGTNTVAGKKIYAYAIYKRTVSYSCSTGTLSGTKCVTSKSANRNTTYTYSCSSGYTAQGSGSSMRCYKTTNKNYSSTCPLGYSKSGNTCVATTSKISNNTCPSGYTKSGSTCYQKTSANTNTYCPTGYIKNGNTCYKNTNITIETSCPFGYTKNGNACVTTTSVATKSGCPNGYTLKNDKCYIKTNANYNKADDIYTCPTGYIKQGKGVNTICYQNARTNDTFYCNGANEVLKGTKCVSSVTKCPNGFVNNNGVCLKTTNDYQNPIYRKDYAYSAYEYMDGYTRTGRASFITTCSPITK